MASEQPVSEVVPSWFVMWACLCSDVRVKRADLPRRCPGHDRELVANPAQIDALAQFVGVHECPTGETAKCPPPAKAVA